ncbi:unnamed protein product [Strongylus vulgaris]|uniref:Uncharacterized protein n=1 Tax=Strongylus vulgaris TaxID=40348 RepID=A0A3P7JKA4_STRVU|nr:unnamed protein product [Strongylus vulgaris]
MEALDKEEERRRRRKKRRVKRSRGVKPVIPLKPSQEKDVGLRSSLLQLKKALNDFLEMQTQTIGSVMDEDEGGSKSHAAPSRSRKKAGLSIQENSEKRKEEGPVEDRISG